MRVDAGVLPRAGARLATWEASRQLHPELSRAWRAVFELPIEVLAARLIEDTPEMARLRSVSPFAGELEPRERWRLWREVRASER